MLYNVYAKGPILRVCVCVFSGCLCMQVKYVQSIVLRHRNRKSKYTATATQCTQYSLFPYCFFKVKNRTSKWIGCRQHRLSLVFLGMNEKCCNFISSKHRINCIARVANQLYLSKYRVSRNYRHVCVCVFDIELHSMIELSCIVFILSHYYRKSLLGS